MAKSGKVTVVSAWRWFFHLTEMYDIPAAEQLTLLHILDKLNRNYWKPSPISLNQLSALMCKDKRTVQKSIKELVKKGFISVSEDGYFNANITDSGDGDSEDNVNAGNNSSPQNGDAREAGTDRGTEEAAENTQFSELSIFTNAD